MILRVDRKRERCILQGTLVARRDPLHDDVDAGYRRVCTERARERVERSAIGSFGEDFCRGYTQRQPEYREGRKSDTREFVTWRLG